MEGEEKNGETGEGVEKKGRRRLFPLLQEFLWVPMVVWSSVFELIWARTDAQAEAQKPYCGFLKPSTHWRQNRKDVRHSGDKVDRVGDNVDRDKLTNSSCCRFVAKTGNKVDRIRRQSTLLPICRRFRQQSTFNKLDRVEFNFVATA